MKTFLAAVVPLAIAACSPLAPLPTDTVQVAPVTKTTSAPTGPVVVYGGYRVSEPGDWRGVNDAQSEG